MSRQDTIDKVRRLAPWLADDSHVSPIEGGREEALRRLHSLDIGRYGKTRNHLDGGVLRTSPYIRHGVLSLAEVRDHALDDGPYAGGRGPEKFIQQLAWRDYFQRLLRADPDSAWRSIEPLKTGWREDDYAPDLSDDILNGETDSAAMNAFIRELVETGYLHNHARLYLASYVVHFRRVQWQAGAKWFLEHLLDGDLASNNFSWQWVASTNSNKPYYFNLDNLEMFAGNTVDTSYKRNKVFAGTYEDLRDRLFPHAEGSW